MDIMMSNQGQEEGSKWENREKMWTDLEADRQRERPR